MTSGSVQLVISDVDGTIVTSAKEVTPAVSAAARSLGERETSFVLASSRPPAGMSAVQQALGIKGPLAGFNGGLIVDEHGRPLLRHDLDPRLAEAAAQDLRRAGLQVWRFRGNDWFVDDLDAPHVVRESHTIGYPPQTAQDDGWERLTKIVGVSDNLDLVAATTAVLHSDHPDVSASRSQPYYIDVTHPMANKGDAAVFLLGYYGLNAGAAVAIGDGPNDTAMFDVVGLSIAMGNAPDEVKAAADYVTSTNDDDGWARATTDIVMPLTVRHP